MKIVVFRKPDPGTHANKLLVDLPAVLGRDEKNEIYVASTADGSSPPQNAIKSLGIEDRKVSRTHLRVEERDQSAEGGVFVIDHSANGTLVNGLPVDSRDGVQIDVGETEVVVGDTRLFISHYGTAPIPSDRFQFVVSTPSGRETTLTASDGAIVFSAGDSERLTYGALGHDLVLDPESISRASPNWIFVLAEDNDGPFAFASSSSTNVPMINLAAIAKDSMARLSHQDLVLIGGHRIAILDPDGPASVVCPNPTCQLLNARNYHENCRFCGAKLDSATTLLLE